MPDSMMASNDWHESSMPSTIAEHLSSRGVSPQLGALVAAVCAQRSVRRHLRDYVAISSHSDGHIVGYLYPHVLSLAMAPPRADPVGAEQGCTVEPRSDVTSYPSRSRCGPRYGIAAGGRAAVVSPVRRLARRGAVQPGRGSAGRRGACTPGCDMSRSLHRDAGRQLPPLRLISDCRDPSWDSPLSQPVQRGEHAAVGVSRRQHLLDVRQTPPR